MLADSQTYFQVRQTGAKVLSFLFSLSRKRKEKFVRFTRGKTLHDACQSSVEVQPSMHLINSYQLSVRVVILLLIWSIVYFDRCHFDLEVIDQWSFLLLANEMCCVRMMMNNTNDYRQVKIHRKRRATQEHVGKDEREREDGVNTSFIHEGFDLDVHSTTPRHTCSLGMVLLVTIEESSFVDITLHDTQKQEYYTKMNLIGEITFEDHRGALITGYLPSELIRKSIFHIVCHDDRLVKLHALWKCKTADKDFSPIEICLLSFPKASPPVSVSYSGVWMPGMVHWYFFKPSTN